MFRAENNWNCIDMASLSQTLNKLLPSAFVILSQTLNKLFIYFNSTTCLQRIVIAKTKVRETYTDAINMSRKKI